jgi:crotonobetainyl-CoA:carnitine CoA-transferase CaiB-like acyl-CoA transferase
MHASARRQPDLELPTADGMYVIAVNQVLSDAVWKRLVDWMEEKGVAGELTDAKYRDEAVRTADYRQGTAVREGIRRLIAASKGEEVFSRAQASGISWAVIRAPEENYDLPHYQQRNFWRAVEQPEIGRAVPYPRGPFMAEELQIEPRRRAPHLGEHTAQVLERDLGLRPAEIAALAAAGVVR